LNLDSKTVLYVEFCVDDDSFNEYGIDSFLLHTQTSGSFASTHELEDGEVLYAPIDINRHYSIFSQPATYCPPAQLPTGYSNCIHPPKIHRPNANATKLLRNAHILLKCLLDSISTHHNPCLSLHNRTRKIFQCVST